MEMPEEIYASETRVGVHGIYGSWTTNEHPTDFQGKIRSKNRHRVKYTRAPQWQTMGSAPRDGTHVLVRDSHADNTTVAYSYDTERLQGGNWHVVGGDSMDGNRLYEATHWQPLPAPPEVV